jgi:hypothetical protein
MTAFLAQRIYELNAKLIAAEEALDEARDKLHNIAEIYSGMDGGHPQTLEGKYLMHIIKQMYACAVKGEQEAQ